MDRVAGLTRRGMARAGSTRASRSRSRGSTAVLPAAFSSDDEISSFLARTQLDETRFAAEWAWGQQTPFDQVIAEALALLDRGCPLLFRRFLCQHVGDPLVEGRLLPPGPLRRESSSARASAT